VAHADDETIGMGGTLARHAAAGDAVSVLVIADGETSRNADGIRNDADATSISDREDQARRACGHLGVKTVCFSDLPDNAMDTVSRLSVAKVVEQHIAKFDPTIIYTHHNGDVNIDHNRVSEAVTVATRAQPSCNVKSVLFFETASSTEWQQPLTKQPFLPNWYVDIDAHWELKKKALEVYKNEMREFPHTRSVEAIESLAKWRGASAGLAKAEAFVLARHIS
jgi:LmbE family N-acetylglucosaminyl deacetylase